MAKKRTSKKRKTNCRYVISYESAPELKTSTIFAGSKSLDEAVRKLENVPVRFMVTQVCKSGSGSSLPGRANEDVGQQWTCVRKGGKTTCKNLRSGRRRRRKR